MGTTGRVLILLLAYAGMGARAETVAVAGAGGNWSDPATWDGGTLPGAGDTVVFNYSGTAELVVDQSVTVDRIEVQGTSPTRWNTVTIPTGVTLTVTGDFVWKNYAKLYQHPGSVISANRYLVGSTNYGRVAWEIQGTAQSRAKVQGAGGVDVNTDPANGGHAAATAIDQSINWNYADFDVDGPVILPLARNQGSDSSRLLIDHCLFDDTGYFYSGQYLRGDAPVRVTNSDFRFSGTNPNNRKASNPFAGASVIFKRSYAISPGTDDLFDGNVFSYGSPNADTSYLYFSSAGPGTTIARNVFSNFTIEATYSADAFIAESTFDIYENLFFVTDVLNAGMNVLISRKGGADIHDNLFLSQPANAHVLKTAGVQGQPKDIIEGNVFEATDGDADTIMLGGNDVEVLRNIFVGNGTPLNIGITGKDTYRNAVDPEAGDLLVSRNTVHINTASTLSGLFVWNGETTYHGGDVVIQNNIVGEYNTGDVAAYVTENDPEPFPDGIDWVDYTWFYNANGGSLTPYLDILITGKVQGQDEGFGLHDGAGDPQYKNSDARVALLDGYLQGDQDGSEGRLLREFMKRNENVPGETFAAQYQAASALAYFRDAFTPQNSALDNTGRDGEDLGAVDIVGVPNAPTGVEPVSVRDGEVTLRWVEPLGGGVGDYEVQYRAIGESTWLDFPDLAITEYVDDTVRYVSGVVTGLVNGTAYEFQVRAASTLGASDYSEPSPAVIPLPIVAPGMPQGLAGSAADGQVNLSWTAPDTDGGSAITDYVIQYKASAEPTVWTLFADEVGTLLSASIPGLVNGTSYDFRVFAVNAAGDGAPASTTQTPGAVPGSPLNLTAVGADTVVTLSWAAPSDGGSALVDYIIQYRPSTGSESWATFDDGIGTGTVAEINGLLNGVPYDFQVSAQNALGLGIPSLIATATPAGAEPEPLEIGDWLSFALAEPSAVTVSVDSTLFAVGLGLYDEQENSVADIQSTWTRGSHRAVLSVNCGSGGLAAGTYKVLVSPDTLNSGRGYSLGMMSAPCSAEKDRDGDGYTNTTDNCIYDANPTQADLDGNGVGDACDPDVDGDGVDDLDDSSPFDANNSGAVIGLSPGNFDSARYGHRWGEAGHYSVLIAKFQSDGSDKLLHMVGQDIDYDDEVSVILNGRLLGYLSPGPDNGLNTPSIWWLPGDLQRVGENRIQLLQKVPGYKWGVTDLAVLDPGTAWGNLKTLSGGDRAHASGVELHLPGSRVGYLLELTGYDIDWGDEVGLDLNGAPLVDLPKGQDKNWSNPHHLLLPPEWLTVGDNVLHIRNLRDRTYDWGVRFDRLLPMDAALGNRLPGQLPNDYRGDSVSFLLAPMAADVEIALEFFDVDVADEIRIIEDGINVGFAAVTDDNAWGIARIQVLPAGLRSVIELDNTYIPGSNYSWGVRATMSP